MKPAPNWACFTCGQPATVARITPIPGGQYTIYYCEAHRPSTPTSTQQQPPSPRRKKRPNERKLSDGAGGKDRPAETH